MSRSGYSDDLCDYPGQLELYRSAVERAINGKRGQAFLRELIVALDAMPEKKLIAGELVNGHGEVCALGCVGKSRGFHMEGIDYTDSKILGKKFGIAKTMAAEIEFINDDDFCDHAVNETPDQRWQRVRKWAEDNLKREVEK